MIAFSNRPIGIDIEDYSKSFNYSSILKNYFIYELEKFKNIDTRAFYTFWTVKEACLKFYARGIRDLQSINIVGINNEAARAVSLIEKQVMDILMIGLLYPLALKIDCLIRSKLCLSLM